MGCFIMTKRKNNNGIEESEDIILKTKVKHLIDDLRLPREENEILTKNYFEIHSKLEQKVEERTAELTKVNKQLNVEIQERKRVEKALHKVNEELETRVADRTADIAKANEELRSEIFERKRTEIELQKLKEAAEAANQAKSEFLTNMSHELRTPLNHILGFTELVVDKNFGDLNDAQEEYLNDVLSSSKHLLTLINDILDLSKVEAGKLELEPSNCNPKILLGNSLIMIKEKAMKHGIRLSYHIDDSIPEIITADERKLKQVMYNLLSNAVKFTQDGGEIRLEANLADDSLLLADNSMEKPSDQKQRTKEQELTASQKFVRISVTDTGIGIKHEDLERIFNPFEQLERSASRRFQGTGLGLPLSKNLVQLHGGKLWGKSGGKGKGSTFRFIIPLQVQKR